MDELGNGFGDGRHFEVDVDVGFEDEEVDIEPMQTGSHNNKEVPDDVIYWPLLTPDKKWYACKKQVQDKKY